MALNLSFWIQLTAFQIAFGLTVFSLTRQYYIQDPANVSAESAEIRQPASVWPDGQANLNSTQLNSSTFGQASVEDPVEVTRQANEYIAAQKQEIHIWAWLVTPGEKILQEPDLITGRSSFIHEVMPS